MSPLEDLLQQKTFTNEEIARLRSLTPPDECEALRARAYDLTTELMGDAVYFRGLIEISNICTANCRYCGIRKDNHSVVRYTLDEDTILSCARLARDWGYGSIAIQAGERRDEKWVAFIERILTRIHAETLSDDLPDGLGVTLSLGEQLLEVYERWAAAHGSRNNLRYLLRIESSNPTLFNRLHCTPGKNEKVLENRYRALMHLRQAGYQVGTGVMIGLPSQTVEDLVGDIRTFQRLDADMIGMGPYLTSLGADMVEDGQMEHDALLRRTLNMIAVTRLVLRDTNIAAATALETLQPRGRIAGIRHGCNVIMPNITPQATRSSYQLYDNKAGTEVGAESNRLLEADIVRLSGRRIGFNLLGSSKHWAARTNA